MFLLNKNKYCDYSFDYSRTHLFMFPLFRRRAPADVISHFINIFLFFTCSTLSFIASFIFEAGNGNFCACPSHAPVSEVWAITPFSIGIPCSFSSSIGCRSGSKLGVTIICSSPPSSCSSCSFSSSPSKADVSDPSH